MKNKTKLTRFFALRHDTLNLKSNLLRMTRRCAAFTLAEVPEARQHGSKQVAFTLAEVLITLGIIGVVAAMTIPTLTKNYQRRILKTRFQQSHAILAQALLKTKAELGENLASTYTVYNPQSRNYDRASEFINTFLKHCNYTGELLPYYEIHNFSGEVLSSNKTMCATSCPKPRFLLRNGASVGMIINASRIDIDIDVNGPSQKPNRYGYDVFTFIVNSQDALIPLPRRTQRDVVENESSDIWLLSTNPCSKLHETTSPSNGYGCSWYALHDQNPDDASKGYWESLDF